MTGYDFSLQSNLKNISPLLADLETKWKSHGLPEETIFALRLALNEALANAVTHGNKRQETLEVAVSCRIHQETIELEVTDQGQGFDPLSIPDPTDAANIPQAGGRGVYLMRKFMDRVHFLEGGHKVLMTKAIQSGGPMNISKSKDGITVICTLEGEVNIDNSFELRKVFDEIIKEGGKEIIVDCARLTYIDSSGLATLIEMFQRLQKQNGTLKLCSLNEKVKGVFEITKLDTLFAIYDTVQTAQGN